MHRTTPLSTIFPYTTLFRSTNDQIKEMTRKVSAEPLFRSTNDQIKEMTRKVSAEVDLVHQQTQNQRYGSSHIDRKSGSAGMPRPISYAVFCLKKKKESGVGE